MKIIMPSTLLSFLICHCFFVNVTIASLLNIRRNINSSGQKLLLSAPVQQLLQVATQPQSIKNAKKVEKLIENLTELGRSKRQQYMKPIQGGAAYRTIWTTVTAASPIGIVLREKPASVLGGQSWQVVDQSRTNAENIVYWKRLSNLRMAGLATLKPFASGKDEGYDLTIAGLQFRRSKGPGEAYLVPEKFGKMGPELEEKSQFTIFKLRPDDKPLSNGVGTLEVLFNDGNVRITKDVIQNNTYIHYKEPLPQFVEELLAI